MVVPAYSVYLYWHRVEKQDGGCKSLLIKLLRFISLHDDISYLPQTMNKNFMNINNILDSKTVLCVYIS